MPSLTRSVSIRGEHVRLPIGRTEFARREIIVFVKLWRPGDAGGVYVGAWLLRRSSARCGWRAADYRRPQTF